MVKITPDDVWKRMPRQSSGPAWKSLIESAIDHLEAYGNDIDFDTSSDVAHEFADTSVVYYKDIADTFMELDLWANDGVEDMAMELGAASKASEGIIEVMSAYVYAAYYLTSMAVISASQELFEED